MVPVCLPRRGAAFPLGRDSRLVAAGWGKTTRGRFQGDISTLGVHRRTPQKVELPHVSPGRCEAAYQRDLYPRFFCAGGRRGIFELITEIIQYCPKLQARTPATATAGGRWWLWRRGAAGAASGGTSCTWSGSSPSGRSRAGLESQVRKWRTRRKRNTDHPFFLPLQPHSPTSGTTSTGSSVTSKIETDIVVSIVARDRK